MNLLTACFIIVSGVGSDYGTYALNTTNIVEIEKEGCARVVWDKKANSYTHERKRWTSITYVVNKHKRDLCVKLSFDEVMKKIRTCDNSELKNKK